MKYVNEYYFFDGRYTKISYKKVRKLKNEEKFKLKNRQIILRFSTDLKKKMRKSIAEFIQNALCEDNEKIKNTIMNVSMLYDVKISYKIKCGKKLLLFIRTP